MKFKTLAFVYVSLLAFNTNANEKIAQCTSIKNDSDRLKCFDNFTKKALKNDDNLGDWLVFDKLNPIDDSQTITLQLTSEGKASRYQKKPYLILRCKSEETDAYIGWNDYLGSNDLILTRIGSSKATTSEWGMSTDKKATFHPKPIKFIKKLMKADKLVAQVTPYNDSPITAIFNTNGLTDALKSLKSACHW